MNRQTQPTPIDRWSTFRPLTLFTICFLVGLVIGRAAPSLLLFWGIGSGVMTVLAVLFRKRALIFPLALLLGAVWISLTLVQPAPIDEKNVPLTGRVASDITVKEHYTRILLKDVEINGQRYPSNIMAYFYCDTPPLACGDSVSLTANIHPPEETGTPGAFDYAAWLWRKKAALIATVSHSENIAVTDHPVFSFMRSIYALRARLSGLVLDLYDDDCEGMALALIVGDKSEMPEEIRDSFRKAGASHLLALSGLHVGVLFVCIEWLLRKLHVHKKAAFALCLVMMGFYALLVGLPASILRAAIMFALVRLARFDGRPRDSATILCTALIILLLVNPLYIEDAGFLLSFSALGGLIGLGSGWPIHEKRKAGSNKLRSLVRSAVAAQLGTLPFIACLFNELPVWFLPGSVLLIPMMTFLFPALVASAVVGCVYFPFGQLLARIIAWPMRFFIVVTDFCASLPFSLIRCADWPVVLLILYALAALAATPYFPSRRLSARRIAAITVMLMTTAAAILLPALTNLTHSGLDIAFLDVGQGDAAVIHADSRYYMMDVGEDSTAADYLVSQGIVPDGVLLSHGHADHAGGLLSLVKALPPCPLYLSESWPQETHDAVVDEAVLAAQAAGWPIIYLKTGDRLALSDSVSAKVWNTGGNGDNINENCLVLSVSHGQSTALFTGDLPMEGEWIPLPDCTVLKVGHHGSAGSTGQALLMQTSPDVAVISVGRNTYGHPTQTVLDKLSDTALYRTDECGTVTITLCKNGDSRVRTWRAR